MSAPKRGLGRGLDALLQGTTEPAVRTLALTKLHANRRQPRQRFSDPELDELAASIRAQGVIQPLVVSADGDGTFTIVAGERRFRAARRAGLAEVPVVVRQAASDRELLELALVENLQRADLNALEEAEAYRSLQEDFGLTQDELAERVGKSRPAVANALRLLKLPPPVQDLVRGGELSAGQARPLLALESPARQEELARQAVAEGLSARDLERLCAASTAPRARRAKAAAEPNAAAAAERLTQKLQTRVEIVRRGRGGTVRIHFHSEEELMRLYELLILRGGRS
jgi:ParB family chromosome partitioning protein